MLNRYLIALAGAALSGLGPPSLAQDRSGPNLGTTAEGTAPGGVATMGLAQDLYAAGVAQGDAVTVLAAARLAATVELVAAEAAALDPARITFTDGDATARQRAAPAAPAAPAPRLNDGSPRAVARARFFTAANTDEGAADAPVTADTMFARATDLAAGDEALLGLIADAKTGTARGRVGGAVEWLSRLPSGQTDVWEIAFYGNSLAEVAVVGDGDANLDVAVTDETGPVISDDVRW